MKMAVDSLCKSLADSRNLLKRGLMSSDDESLGVLKFSEWIAEHGSEFGNRYQNDLKERKYRLPPKQ